MNCALAALLSVLPVVEVRGSIPYLIALKCPYYYLVASYLASTLTGIAVYFLLEEILRIARAFAARFWKGGERLLDRLIERTQRRASEKVEKYGTIGLALFVAVPLPGTGVWTGALAGYLLGLRPKDVTLALAIGNAIATVVMALASSGLSMALS